MQFDILQRLALRHRWKNRINFFREALGFQIAPHHEEISAAINAHDRLLILLPPGHGKSWACSFGDVVHWALYHPNDRQAVLTLSDRRATDWNKQISEALLSPLIKEVYPDIIPESPDRWNMSAITLNRTVNHKEPSITTMGYGGQIESLRLNRIWIDDVVDEVIARSAVETINLKERFTRIIERRLEPKAFLGVVGTPFGPTDLYAYITSRKDFFVVKRPAINPDGTALWAWKWSLKELMQIKDNSPAHVWIQAYLLDSIASDLCKFDVKWLKGKQNIQVPSSLRIIQALDPAISQDRAADYTAIVTAAVDGRRLIVLDMYADKISSGQALKAHEMAVKWNADETLVETNAFQQIVRNEFDNLLPRKIARPIINYKNKELRIDGLEPFFRNDDIQFALTVPDKYYEMFKFEFCSYPLVSQNHLLDAIQMIVANTIAISGGTGPHASGQAVSKPDGMREIWMDRKPYQEVGVGKRL